MLPQRLFTDCSPISQPSNTYRGAKNIIKLNKSVRNEPGFDQTGTGYPDTIAKPIGAIPFPDNTFALLSDGYNGGQDRIGYVDINGNYSDIIVDDILGFDINFPIRSSEIDYNYLNQKIISWTDFNKPPRILNLNNIPFALNVDKSLVNDADIIELEVFTTFKVPSFTFTVEDIAGAIKAGNYSFAIAYENIDGTRTANSVPIGNINITDDSISSPINSIDGAVPGTLTSKSILIAIDNVDTRYDKLVLIAIAKINSQVTAFEVKKVDINSNSLTITYIGTEIIVPINLQEIVQLRPLYKKSKAQAQLNNVLYHANLEAEDEIDFQSYANDIRIFYNTKLISITDINNSHKNNLPSSFPHGGIYAFYIRLLLKNGSTSRAFPIPGRPAYATEDSSISALATAEGYAGIKVYQFEDTTNQGGHAYSLDGDTTRVTSMASNTNMGFWQNIDEVYPNNFPTLAGQKVRHHVFPTIRQCRLQHYTGIPLYGQQYIDILGIDITNVVIPNGIKDQVEGYQILYAKRDYVNSNTLGNDLLLYGHHISTDANVQWSAGGNWDTNTENGSGPLANQLIMDTDYIRGHSFELLKDKPQISSPTFYLDIEMKLQHTNLDALYSGSGNDGGNLVGSGTNSGTNPGGIIDYTSSNYIVITHPSGQVSKRLEDFKYVPAGIIDGNLRTVKNEEAFQAKVSNPSITPSITTGQVQMRESSASLDYVFSGGASNTQEGTYLITYKQLKNNVYANYDQQILIATDKIVYKDGAGNFASDLIKLRGGDTFTSIRTFVTCSPYHGDDFSGTSILTIQRAHICESRYNIGLRYEVTGDVSTKYYPKEHPYYLWSNSTTPQQDGVTRIFTVLSPNVNGIGYSADYNAINDIYQSTIFNPSQISITKFPFRVIRSGTAGLNSQSIRSWKTYLVDDKYEANRNKGEIENIAVMDDVLLIHHRQACFRTIGKEKMLTSTVEVYLGTGDIFAQQPKDIIPSKLGNLGTQNIFSCFSFKGGYCWQDQQAGKIYLLTSNGVEELSSQGLRIFFQDNLMIDNTLPNNPLLGSGLIGGYDKRINRIIFTKRGTNPFTISYSLEEDSKGWCSYHDYLPDYYFFNNNDIFCFGNNKVFRFNSTTKKCKYLDNTIYSSYIDLVFTAGESTNLLFYNVNWISEVFSSIREQEKTLTHIQVSTSDQDTGEITLVPFSTFGVNYNTRRFKNTWNFNQLKNVNSDPLKRFAMIDNYAIVRFKYSNPANLDLSQNSLYLYDLAIKVQKSEL